MSCVAEQAASKTGCSFLLIASARDPSLQAEMLSAKLTKLSNLDTSWPGLHAHFKIALGMEVRIDLY